MSNTQTMTFYPADNESYTNEPSKQVPFATEHIETPAVTDSSAQKDPESALSRAMTTIKNLSSVSELIRLCGASAIVGSMFMFLVGGATIVNDQQRFFSMLLFTGLLAVAGLAMSWILKEQRGARAFFSLALISVPVNFTVLGALFYSVFVPDAAAHAYPALAKWTVVDISSLTITSAVAVLALIPITFMSFSILARQSSVWLSVALLGSSALLMIPLRDSTVVVPLVTLSSLALLWLIKKRSDGVIALKTPAGRFARTLLFLPAGIMLVRSMWLYQLDATASLVVCATVYILLRHVSSRLDTDTLLQNTLHIVSATIALIVAMLTMVVTEPMLGELVKGGVFALVTTLLTVELQSRVNNITLQRTLSMCGTGLAAAISIGTVLVLDGTAVILFALLNAVVLLAYALLAKHKTESVCALISFAAIALFQLDDIFSLFAATGWWGVASAGGAAILLASMLERYGALLTLKGQRWFQTRATPSETENRISASN